MLAPTHAYVRDAQCARLPAPALSVHLAFSSAARRCAGSCRRAQEEQEGTALHRCRSCGRHHRDRTRHVQSEPRHAYPRHGRCRGCRARNEVRPETGAGAERNAGVKLEGVADGSTLNKLGMRNGDILRTLNGVNLSTPDGMLGAYALLREQKKVTLSVLRDGRPKTITYQFE